MEVKFLSTDERDAIIDTIFAEIKNGQEVEPAIYQFKNSDDWFNEFVATNGIMIEDMTGVDAREIDMEIFDKKLYVMQGLEGDIIAIPQDEFVVQYWRP